MQIGEDERVMLKPFAARSRVLDPIAPIHVRDGFVEEVRNTVDFLRHHVATVLE